MESDEHAPRNTEQPKSWWDTFKKWVEAGKVVQAGLAILIATSGIVWGAYQYFAKTYQLNALRDEQIAVIRALREQQEAVIKGVSCDLAAQSWLSAKLAETHQQTREALAELALVTTVGELPTAIKSAVRRIDGALDTYKVERDRLSQKKIQIGGTVCGL
jgi:hypothetical protein